MSIRDAKINKDIAQEEIIRDSFCVIQYRTKPSQKELNKGSVDIDATGGFFIGEENALDALGDIGIARLIEYGAEKDVVTPEDPKQKPFYVYHIRDLKICILGQRNYWNGSSTTMNVLCLLTGLEDLGPFKLHVSGNAAMAFATTKNGGIYTHKNLKKHSTETIRYESIFVATRVLGSAAQRIFELADPLPRYAFNVTVGITMDGLIPHVLTVGSTKQSSAVLPQLRYVPEEITEEYLESIYVGKHGVTLAEKTILENREWFKAWDNYDPTSNTNGSAPSNGKPAPSVKELEKELSQDGFDLD